MRNKQDEMCIKVPRQKSASSLLRGITVKVHNLLHEGGSMSSMEQSDQNEGGLENEDREILSMSFSYLFGTLEQQTFDNNVEAGKDQSSGLQNAMRNHLFMTKKERLKMLPLGTKFGKSQRCAMYHLLRLEKILMFLS